MADDLDGVGVSSTISAYQAGNHYRVKETDPDESGGGKDFYDGFMREKKDPSLSEEEAPVPEENPIPTVDRSMLHDDIILSQRAKKMLEHVDSEENDEEPPKSSNEQLHVNVKA